MTCCSRRLSTPLRPARGGTEEYGDGCEFELVKGYTVTGIQAACSFAFVKVLLAAAATEHVTDETLATWLRMAKAYNPKFSLEQPKYGIKAVVKDKALDWEARRAAEAIVTGFAVQYQEPTAGKVRLQAVMDTGAWAKLDDKSKRHKKKQVADSRGHDGGSCVVFFADNDDDEEAYL